MSVKSASTFATPSALTIKSLGRDVDRIQPVTFKPYNWLKTAKIFNKRWQRVPNEWIMENADIIVLLFTAKGVDRGDIMKKFYHIYESTKYVHIPIEVIFLPMDETEEDALACFKEQANWFTLRFNDVLVHTIRFMYGISCIPHLTVFNTNCEVISFNGIADVDTYGKNAVISWLTLAATTKKQRRRSDDAEYYGPVWKYVKPEEKVQKYEYHRRFQTEAEPVEDHLHFPGHHLSESQAGAPFDGQILPEMSPVRPPPRDHFKPPEDKEIPTLVSDKPLENITAVPDLPPEGHKSSIIHIKLPEDRSKPLESQAELKRASKAGVTYAPPSGQSKPSESHVQMSESVSKPKIRVQLPEDQSKNLASQGRLSETRSKSATGEPSKSNAPISETRSKSATGQTSESNTQLPVVQTKSVKSAKFMD